MWKHILLRVLGFSDKSLSGKKKGRVGKTGHFILTVECQIIKCLQVAAKGEEQTGLVQKGDIQVKDGKNCWINSLITSPYNLINLIPRIHLALKPALGYLHKCTQVLGSSFTRTYTQSQLSHLYKMFVLTCLLI